MIAAKTSNNNFTLSWRRSPFFEIVKFYSSYKSCNEWPSVLDLSFVLGYADSTSLKFRVWAYSRINTVKVQLNVAEHSFGRL